MIKFSAGRWYASGPFVLAVALVVGVFLFGGSARSDSAGLVAIYPIAGLALSAGIAFAPAERLRRYRWLLVLTGASLLVTLLHLVPLPPVLWHALPERDLVVAIDSVVGANPVWRPLSLSPAGSRAALFALLVPAAALAIGIAIPTRLHRRLVLLVLGMGGLSAVLGMIQILSPASSGWYLHEVANRGLPVGLFANRNHQAAMLACLLPMLAWLASRSGGTTARRRVGAFLSGGAGISLIPLILICGSRAGVALALVGMAGAAWIIASAPSPDQVRARRSKARPRATLLAVAGGALVMLVAAVSLDRGLALQRLQAQELDGEFRFSAWRAIWGMAGDYFPLGSGIGTFREVYRIGEPYDLLSRSYLNHAHNDVLELLLTGGLPAMVILFAAIMIYVGAVVRLSRLGGERAKAQGEEARVQLGRVGAVVIAILATGSIVDYPLRVPSLACLLMLAAMWLAAALRPVERSALESRALRG